MAARRSSAIVLTRAVPPTSNATYLRASCPICGGRASVCLTWKQDQQRYLLMCWACPHGDTGTWLADVTRALDTSTDRLIRDPYGAGLIAATQSGGRGAPDGSGPDGLGSRWGNFPSAWDVHQLARELMFDRAALRARRWLSVKRLVSREVMGTARLGWWDRPGVIVFPLFDARSVLVNVKVRRIGKGQLKTWPAASRGSRGGGSDAFPLFPRVPDSSRVVLVAGELDALALLSRGIPACSVTCGAGGWRDEYADLLGSRDVTVAFDRGEEAAAEYAASQLKRARVWGWPDLPGRNDATDFLKAGWNPKELI